MKPVRSDIQAALQLRNKKLWVLGKNRKSSVESQYHSVFFVSTPLYHSTTQWSLICTWNFQWQKIQHSPDRSGHFWLLQQSLCQNRNLTPCHQSQSAFWNGSTHGTPHLFSIWHSPQIHEDNFILPEVLFSHTTLLKSPLPVLMALRGPQRFLDPKGRTSNDINMPTTDSGEGAGPHKNLASVATWSESTCGNLSPSSVPIFYPRFSTALLMYIFRQIILWGGWGAVLCIVLYLVISWSLPIRSL